MRKRASCAFVIGLAIAGSHGGLAAQSEWNVRSLRPDGMSVTPVFEGWYENPDGTYSLQFGYYNRNLEEALDIPLGPMNFIRPSEFDGVQPTHFQPAGRGSAGSGGVRDWGVFTVVVPADFPRDRDVVWTLVSRGDTASIPGRMTHPNYMLDALGADARASTPPGARASADAAYVFGPSGVTAPERAVSASEPVELDLWVLEEHAPPVTVDWFHFRGPSHPELSESGTTADGDGQATSISAVFREPGDYVVRARVANEETEFDRFCCWTNVYFPVRVSAP